MRRETMKRGKTVDELHNVLSEKHRLLAQPSGKRSALGEKYAHLCGEVPMDKERVPVRVALD